IRVHLSHIGYPIVGDDLYGGKFLKVSDIVSAASRAVLGPVNAPKSLSRTSPLITRSALHAAMLGLAHPMINQPLLFQAPLPNDMRTLIQLLREHRFVNAPKVAGTSLDLARIAGDRATAT